MRLLAVSIALLLMIGCGDTSTESDAGMRIDAPGTVQDCDDVAFAPDGTPCIFGGTCREQRGCCTQEWTCDEGSVRSELTCATECIRTCPEALERGAQGDLCEGAYYCSSFSSDLCCSHEVECAAGRLNVEDTCTPGCG